MNINSDKVKSNSQRAIFEFFSMLIAVVLAMGLTEWRQNHLNRKEAQESYLNILLEIQDNRGDLLNDSTAIGEDLRYIKDFLERFYSDEKPDDFSLGFQLSFLNTSALEVAKINESMAYLPNNVNISISEVYHTQAFYEEKAKEVFNVMAKMNSISADVKSEDFLAKLKEYRFQLRLVRGAIHSYLEITEEFMTELDSLNAAQ